MNLLDLIEEKTHEEIVVSTPASDATKTRQILELLRCRHPAPEWATFAELNEGTGMNGGRLIDFYAMNVWPSKRYVKVAYEIKVSRSDFARELKEPKKREAAEVIADECYFAVPHGLVLPDEIPEKWGLIVMNAGGLRIVKHATQRHITNFSVEFMASLARRSSDKPSPLPAVFWLRAGKELNDEQLVEAANRHVVVDAENRIHQMKKEAVDEYEHKRLVAIRDAVSKALGIHHRDIDPDKLPGLLTSGIKPLPWIVKNRLEQLRRTSAEVMNELTEMGYIKEGF